jgi:hypothetical protein
VWSCAGVAKQIAVSFFRALWARRHVSGIGGVVTRSPLPHRRTCGSAYGGSVRSTSSKHWKAECVEVSNGKSECQSRAVGQTPRTVGTTSGLSRQDSTDFPLAQFDKPPRFAADFLRPAYFGWSIVMPC